MAKANARDVQAAKFLLEACADEFGRAQSEGLLAEWAAMACSMIGLLAAKELPEHLVVFGPGLPVSPYSTQRLDQDFGA